MRKRNNLKVRHFSKQRKVVNFIAPQIYVFDKDDVGGDDGETGDGDDC